MCTCSPGYACKSHRTPEETARMNRQVAAYSRAYVDVQAAERVLAGGMPHEASGRKKLAEAAGSLNAYLAELER